MATEEKKPETEATKTQSTPSASASQSKVMFFGKRVLYIHQLACIAGDRLTDINACRVSFLPQSALDSK
ncbi:UNVERIFIED_CONTAM: hypothetical protein FKN15_060107 [Acipenser sinensis]